MMSKGLMTYITLKKGGNNLILLYSFSRILKLAKL